jgi:hypothetical protein
MKYFTLFLFLFLQTHSISQTWNRDYGVMVPNWFEIGRNIEYINDSLFLFYIDRNPEGGKRFNVSNLNEEGDVNWTKVYESDSTSWNLGGANSTDVLPDMSKFVTGQLYEVLNEDYAQIVVLDQNLDTLYTRKIGNGTDFYSALQARFCEDEGIIATGFYQGLNPTESLKILLIKFDSEGTLEWQTEFGLNSNHYYSSYSVVPLENGHYVTGGSLRQAINTPNRPMLTLFDENGNYLDHRLFGNDEYSEGWAKINPLADGNFIMCATKKESDDYSYYYLAKLDTSLNILWEKEYDALSQESAFLQLKENEDGSLIGVGVWYDPPTAYQYGVIMKFDSEGERLWERKYQHANEGFAQLNKLYDVIEIPENGGYVACGERNELDTGQNAWVIKVDDMGCLVAGCDTLTSVSEITRIEDFTFSVGPNPATDYLNVFIPELPAEFRSNSLALKLVNLEGKTVFSQALNTLDVTFIMDVSEYSRGVYYLSLESEGVKLNTQKIILE